MVNVHYVPNTVKYILTYKVINNNTTKKLCMYVHIYAYVHALYARKDECNRRKQRINFLIKLNAIETCACVSERLTDFPRIRLFYYFIKY